MMLHYETDKNVFQYKQITQGRAYVIYNQIHPTCEEYYYYHPEQDQSYRSCHHEPWNKTQTINHTVR